MLVVGLNTTVSLSDKADFAFIKAVIISPFNSVSKLNMLEPLNAPVFGTVNMSAKA